MLSKREFDSIMNYQDLNQYIDEHFDAGKYNYILIDEVQDVESWHLFLNRLLRTNLHIVVTGSNAKLLSGELATHLTGRYNEIHLFPFS